MILWIHLMHDHLLDQLIQESYDRPILVFVHNRFEASSNERMKKIEMQSKALPSHLRTYYLDGLKYPNLVRQIYQRLNLVDQRPSAMVISLGRLKSELVIETSVTENYSLAPAAA